jgi:hypothetical protein
MARKYAYVRGRYAWNLEICEEEILIAGYDEIRSFIAPDQTPWRVEFESRFFDIGEGIAQLYIDAINTVRKRHSLNPIAIRETEAGDYCRTNDKVQKAINRRRIREELREMTDDDRRSRIQLAESEIARLPEPHHTFEEYDAWRQQLKNDERLSHEEVSRRKAAREEKKATEAIRTLPPNLANRMLSLASEAIWPDIIAKLSAEDALEVAAEIDNSKLKDALVKHALSM